MKHLKRAVYHTSRDYTLLYKTLKLEWQLQTGWKLNLNLRRFRLSSISSNASYALNKARYKKHEALFKRMKTKCLYSSKFSSWDICFKNFQIIKYFINK